MKEIKFISSRDFASIFNLEWHDSVDLNNWWIDYRYKNINFELLKINNNIKSHKIADVGCGSGVFSRQLFSQYQIEVDNIDIDIRALSINKSNHRYFYNIYDSNESFRNTYDVIFLMDVLEHIEDQDKFLVAIRGMLKDEGLLVINVPAINALYSNYDKAVGHCRRYSRDELIEILKIHNFHCNKCMYWGFFLIPLLFARKLYLTFFKSNVVQRGWRVSSFSNLILKLICLIELKIIGTNKIIGTSLIYIGKKCPYLR